MSSETLQDLWRKSASQIEQLSKAEKAINNKKTKAQLQVEDAEKRQKILLDIMRKELSHNQRLVSKYFAYAEMLKYLTN